MAGNAGESVSGFLVYAKPHGENDHICTFLTVEQGKISCRFRGNIPALFREVQIKVSHRNGFNTASDFRYKNSTLVASSQSSYFGLYLNELVYRLYPNLNSDNVFYGCYMSTLIQLNLVDAPQRLLRFFEMSLLELNGVKIDFNFESNQMPIFPDRLYNFAANSGFYKDIHGRYQGQQVLSAGQLSASIKGALGVARECLSVQMDSVLEGKQLNSRIWPLPKRVKGDK
jgi:hypothetical protein